MLIKARFTGLVVIGMMLLVSGKFVWAQASDGVTILDAKSLWRCRIINGSIPLRNGSGKLEYVFESQPWKWSNAGGKRHQELRKTTRIRFRPAPPAAEWVRPDFDDGSWGRFKGPFSGARIKYNYLSPHTMSYRTRQIYLRGKFIVNEPAKTGDMNLSFTFLGGAVVYLNGTEIGRSHLPKGKLAQETFAEDYPLEAYVCPKGKVLYKAEAKKHPDRFKLRLREFKVRVPASALRKGTNVLALEIRCAPANEAMFLGKGMRSNYKHAWSRVGLEDLKLTSAPGATVVSDAALNSPKGVRVWNHSIVRRLYVASRGNPAEPLRSIEISGTRNGVFSGQVVVGSSDSIKGLKVVVKDLKGPGEAAIPAAAVKVRFALPDGPHNTKNTNWRSKTPYFDSLEGFPPAEVSVFQKSKAAANSLPTPLAVQPVWVTVRVPKEARPGAYHGNLTVTAQGIKPVVVPITLNVMAWTLSDSKDYISHMDLVQSPDTLAKHYEVEMWSEKHWQLIEKSLELLGQLGNDVLYIPLIAKTHFGNEHSMVRWVVDEGGRFNHDFSIAERYLDLVIKHMGKVPVVCLYCWEPAKVAGHFAHGANLGEREILYSVLDPVTGKLEIRKGPQWGTSECRRFWKPVMKGMRNILKKRGMSRSMMLGIVNDFVPSDGAINNLTAVAPEAKWVVHSHGRWTSLKGDRDRPVGYAVYVWETLHGPASEPHYGSSRYYGWKNADYYRMAKFTRGRPRMWSLPTGYRIYPQTVTLDHGKHNSKRWPDGSIMSGVLGIGRDGADFWPVIKGKRRNLNLAGYYSPWGGLDINSYGLTYVLGPGKDGAVPTIRFEMLRESIQELEAKIFVEKALTDPEKKAKLGDDRAAHLQEILDEHARAVLAAYADYHAGCYKARWFASSDWQKRSEGLFSAAAEVAEALKK